jgi:methylmalonyl-CoA mutase
MNAAIDQECEKYIEQNNLWTEVEKAFKQKFQKDNYTYITILQSPERLPEGNSGLGLKLLGLSGDEVLPKDIYEQLKAKALQSVKWYSTSRYFKRRSGTEYLYFFYRICLKVNGRCTRIFYSAKCKKLL